MRMESIGWSLLRVWGGRSLVKNADWLGIFSPHLGVIKQMRGTYWHYLTKAGRDATAAPGRLTKTLIIPPMIWGDFLVRKSRTETKVA
jgi:hypothetical protein